MNVVVIGLVNYDFYVKIDNEIVLKDFNFLNIYSILGGVVYNVVKNLKFVNVNVILIVVVGNDLEV